MGIHLLSVFEPDQGDVTRMLQLCGDRHSVHDLDMDLERLTELLSGVATSYRDGAWLQVEYTSDQVSKQATRLGLNRIARVARNIGELVHGGDEAALAANVARLVRLGEGALEQVWQMPNRGA